MQINFRQIAAFSIMGAALLVSGCATNDDVARAQHTADQAMSTAEQAQQSATSAQQQAQAADQKAQTALSNVKALEQRMNATPPPKPRHRGERG
ncbi:MAG: hypothetical protein KGO02_14560 [Alphaproteobacteria bacterium]|nr:hypothetical protein [Alphaproteobacteria bacterium]